MANRGLCRRLVAAVAGLLAAGAAMPGAADTATRDLPAWSIVLDQSELTFSGDSIIGEVSGGFRQFGGTIRFDPEAPERARISVTVATDSLYADPDMATNNLKEEAFFATEQYPRAVVDATDIEPRDPGQSETLPADATAYRLTAEITIKAATETIDLPVVLRIDGDKAHASGEVLINRLDFDIGTGTWSADWLVSHEVAVAFDVVAQRQNG